MKPPPSSSHSSSILKRARLSPYLLALVAFIVFVTILFGEDFSCIIGDRFDFNQPSHIHHFILSSPVTSKFDLMHQSSQNIFLCTVLAESGINWTCRPYWCISTNSFIWNSFVLGAEKKAEKLAFAIGEKSEESCDLFNGRWVWDEERPLYKEAECPYIQPQLTCQEHGRPDKDYQHWRWQPHGCSLPRSTS